MGRAEYDGSLTTRDITHPWGRANEFRRISERSVPLLFLRSNGTLFCSLGAAYLLETLAPACAERMAKVFPDDDAFRDWLRMDWAPRRTARAHQLKEYLALSWPEFDLAAAHDRFLQVLGRDAAHRPASPAQEALSRCAAASQSALFYRCLAQWAEDVRLREMASRMAREDGSAFARLRVKYEASARAQRLGLWTSWRSAQSHVRDARDRYVQGAFDALVAQWGPNAPFPAMDYAEFVKRVKAAVERYGQLGWPEWLVLKAWASPPLASVPATEPRRTRGFKPVLAPETGESPVTYYSWGLPVGRRV